jgi:hypothetical protein
VAGDVACKRPPCDDQHIGHHGQRHNLCRWITPGSEMTVLLFNDRGWEVATASWTAAAKQGRPVQIAYTWGANSVGWAASATGTSRVTLDMTMEEFVKLVRDGGVVDLRR